MELTIKGVVIELLEIKSGVGQENKAWSKQEVIIETSDKYPKKVCLGFWNDLIKPYKIGSEISVNVNIISKEYNGKWYTEVKVYKVLSSEVDSSPVSKPAESASNDSMDLPF